MKSRIFHLIVGASLSLSALGAGAQDIVKVGIIAPLSGQFSASFGVPFRQGVEAWVAENGNKVAGKQVKFIWRDLDAPNPERAKAIAQELIIKEKVQYLAGFDVTPNALAVAPLIQRAKIPTVIFNASTSMIVSKSDYFVRVSNTLPQVTVPVAKFALETGVKRIVTIVTDYGPGVDAENAFRSTFQAGGGTVVESIRMPFQSTDFGPFLQKIRAVKPDALFAFLPFGPPTFGFLKAYDANGLRTEKIRFLGTGETQETDLQALGNVALTLETGYYYSSAHDSPENKAFLKTLAKIHPKAVANPATVSAYDGARLIYRMIEATGGLQNGEKAMAAVKGWSFMSPRGPVKIDATTRDIVQNVYMRTVERSANGELVNREFKTYAAQPDYGVQK